MDVRFLTDRGQVRLINEDAGGVFYNEPGQLLAVIADGMGGHQAGDVASSMAVSLMEQEWKRVSALFTPDEAEKWMHQTLEEINEQIYDHASEHKECEGMGTTIVALVLAREYITVAHIGDSRCYVSNGEKNTLLTEDHSLVNELLRSGEISEQDAHHHPRKNVVLKALGTEKHVDADIRTLTIEGNERILLCTDGLTDKVYDDEVETFMNDDEPVATISEQMIDLANERGGEDNISLILIDTSACEEEGEKTC